MSNNILTLDLETMTEKRDGKHDNSPMNPNLRCVGAYYKFNDGEVCRSIFHHKDKDRPDSPDLLKQALEWADVIVCHNAKFDIFWLMAMGFKIPETIWCTQLHEYIFARGQRRLLSLKETAERRDVTRKKSDLVDEMFKSGTGFDKMPLDIVNEYAEADVQSTYEIYLQQAAEMQLPENKGLQPVLDLSHDMLRFLLEIETNGIKIDLGVLSEVEATYRTEKAKLEADLSRIILTVMGDTPINLNSGADMTKVVYSRQVINRDKHQEVWNIGVDHRGRPLRRPVYNRSAFQRHVRETTQKVYRTVAHQCVECSGSGKIQKVKKDGSLWKKKTTCPVCKGAGALYVPTSKVAGLKLIPTDVNDASINGFKTDKITIKKLIRQARSKDNHTAVEFLTKISRLNAINTYLDSFITGIQTWTRDTGLLHSTFNQTVTATGRLSSTNPNFQNLPKGNKFEVRRAIVSRFKNGLVAEIDYSGLEFRVAGELSRDKQIIDDVLNGKDVHRQTASIILQKPESEVTKDERSAAKAMTFQPLYGGMGSGLAPHERKYFSEYFVVYKGLKRWHDSLVADVLRCGIIKTPSGREFAFPSAKRLRSGRVTNHTQVVNFPCQSFATADIVPLACIRALRAFKRANLQSKIILSVHDSIVVDIHPDEVTKVETCLRWAMTRAPEEIKKRFNYELALPLDVEFAIGPNWMEIQEVSVDSAT